MIIGISGKIGSGKDTVGKIIQYLCRPNNITSLTLDNWSDNQLKEIIEKSPNKSNWEIKKFADSLKDMVCILIGCTREQLEDADFKNTELSEEWWFNHIVPEHGFGSKLINWDKDLKPQKMTPRLLLQLLGTECGRNIIHPNIWINALFAKYKSTTYTDISKDCPRQNIYDVTEADELHYGSIKNIYPNWIITDVRFPNELKAVKDRGGISIRVNRLSFRTQETEFGKVSTVIQPEVDKLMGIQEHPSETALDNAKFDYTIENNGTIEELIEKVKEILIKEKVI